jgi:hypothetical protein
VDLRLLQILDVHAPVRALADVGADGAAELGMGGGLRRELARREHRPRPPVHRRVLDGGRPAGCATAANRRLVTGQLGVARELDGAAEVVELVEIVLDHCHVHRRADRPAQQPLPLGDLGEQMLDRARHDPALVGALAKDGVRLARAGLAVGEAAGVEATHHVRA